MIFKNEAPAPYKWANPRKTASLAEVLKPRTDTNRRTVERPALQVAPGSPQAALLDKVAAKLRSIYNAGRLRISYDEKEPERFFDAAWGTLEAWLELEQVVEDPATLAFADAVWERAGLLGGWINPTTLRAQVEMQLAVLDAAKAYRLLVAKQQELTLH
jgi:hypothetical protein